MHYVMSITTPQDAHKRLVLQVAEWLTASLYQHSRRCQTRVDYITFSTGFKKRKALPHIYIVCKEREPINSDTGIEKSASYPMLKVEPYGTYLTSLR